jgi:hypothetical protein
VSLSDLDRTILSEAGTTANPTRRQQAVAIVLARSGAERAEAQEILVAGYLKATAPSFHLIPRGDAMATEQEFTAGYDVLALNTKNFNDVSVETLARVLLAEPSALSPLRMIVGFTRKELAVAANLLDTTARVTEGSLKAFERRPPGQPTGKRRDLVDLLARTVSALMDRTLLDVPTAAAENFHSKLDKRDTRDGWEGVRSDAAGVPYSALLYQRYVGGVWRQVQDAYSEVKGDNLLELPISTMFDEAGIPYYRTPSGASGAAAAAAKFGLSPGPDFVLPEETPSVIIEAKIGEDGGTVRDKASRIKNLADFAHSRGLLACAVIDGKGWSERPSALADVIVATSGRTYTLSTLPQLLDLPQIASLRNNRDCGERADSPTTEERP